MTAMAGQLAGPRWLLSPSTSSVLYAMAPLLFSSYNILRVSFCRFTGSFQRSVPSWSASSYGMALFCFASCSILLLFIFDLFFVELFSLAFRYLVRYTDCFFCGHMTVIAWSGMSWEPLFWATTQRRIPSRGGWPILVYRWIVFVLNNQHLSKNHFLSFMKSVTCWKRSAPEPK